MKKSLKVLVISLMFVLVGGLVVGQDAFGKEVTLSWNATDFASVGSDPAKSGYKLYHSFDDGVTKTVKDGTIGMTETSYGPFEEPGPGKACYFLTAFNGNGESGFSEPACAYIETGTPPIPDGVTALLQEIVALLRGIAEKM